MASNLYTKLRLPNEIICIKLSTETDAKLFITILHSLETAASLSLALTVTDLSFKLLGTLF